MSFTDLTGLLILRDYANKCHNMKGAGIRAGPVTSPRISIHDSAIDISRARRGIARAATHRHHMDGAGVGRCRCSRAQRTKASRTQVRTWPVSAMGAMWARYLPG